VLKDCYDIHDIDHHTNYAQQATGNSPCPSPSFAPQPPVRQHTTLQVTDNINALSQKGQAVSTRTLILIVCTHHKQWRSPTWLHTMVSISHCVGLTLPGMILLPGSFAGSWTSPMPHRGPLPNNRTSFAICVCVMCVCARARMWASNEMCLAPL